MTTPPTNLLADLPLGPSAEIVGHLLSGGSFRVERIVSVGQASPPDFWYDQPSAEWVLLLAGAARLRFDDGEIAEMTAGSAVNIPARRRHRVDWTDPAAATVWLAIHYDAAPPLAGNGLAPLA